MALRQNFYGRKKNIGTMVPLFSLWSEKTNNHRGTFEDALYFLDWLHTTGQHAWQLLPLHETPIIPGTDRHVASPYKSYGIGLDPRYLPESYKKKQPTTLEYELFLKQQHFWIEEYALFCSLRDHFRTDNWAEWEETIKRREPETIENWKRKLSDQMQRYMLEQWQLLTAFSDLREKADQYGILLLGDAPYYLSKRSPLVWAYQQIFHINADGSLPRVSGVPQRPRELYGRQLWGHPLYRWDEPALHPHIISLWKHRLHYLERLHDIVRLDHAVGFFHYGSLDTKNPHNDEIIPGPGKHVFKEIITYAEQIGLHLYAEEAAVELKDLREALAEFHIPGIRVLRFVLNTAINAIQRDYADPHHYPINSFAYTTVHDTEPLHGFIQGLTQEQKQTLAQTIGVEYSTDNKVLSENLRQIVIDSPSEMVIIQIQDWLLTSERINTPGTEKEDNDPNWQYRLPLPIEKLPLINPELSSPT